MHYIDLVLTVSLLALTSFLLLLLSCHNTSASLRYPIILISLSFFYIQCFPNQSVDVSYDYEMLPSRRPKFLAQTAAHVSGAAYYYQKSDILSPPWGDKVSAARSSGNR